VLGDWGQWNTSMARANGGSMRVISKPVAMCRFTAIDQGAAQCAASTATLSPSRSLRAVTAHPVPALVNVHGGPLVMRAGPKSPPGLRIRLVRIIPPPFGHNDDTDPNRIVRIIPPPFGHNDDTDPNPRT
jgi:hypothetical protein